MSEEKRHLKTLAELVGKEFPPLDIEHADEKELLSYRMIGLSDDEEERMYKRLKELGILDRDELMKK